MKKFFTLITLVIALSISIPSFAIDPGAYVGVGGSLIFEDFDTDINIEDTQGINLKLGYRVNDISSWEFNFDFLPNFEGDYSTTYYGYPINADMDGNIKTYMLVSKISPNFGSKSIRPFAVAGFGVMQGNVSIEGEILYDGVIYTNNFILSETDMCAKIGAGMDFFIEENTSIGFEYAYIWGFGDLEEVRYMDFTFGIAYHF